MRKQVALSPYPSSPSTWLNMIVMGIILHHICAATAQTQWADIPIKKDATLLFPILNIASSSIGVGYLGIELLNQNHDATLPIHTKKGCRIQRLRSRIDRGLVGLNVAANVSASTLMWFPKQSRAYWSANSLNLITFWLNPNSRKGVQRIIRRQPVAIQEHVALKNAWLALWGILAVAFLVTENREHTGSSVCYMINGVSSLGLAAHRFFHNKQSRASMLHDLKRPAILTGVSSLMGMGIALMQVSKRAIHHPLILIVQMTAAIGTFLEHYQEMEALGASQHKIAPNS